MEPTTEVRWWWRGRPPRAVETWFAGQAGATRDERVDHYLVAVADPDTGIKARAGERLEVKTLIAREDDVALTPTVVGTVERWAKWSFALAPGEPTDDLDGHERTWVPTHKRRVLRDVDGCEVELTTVDVGSSWWWTLALEAPGADESARELLVAATSWLLSTGTPDELSFETAASRGYAALVGQVEAD